VGEELVEIHGAHDRSDIGHGQNQQGLVHIRDFIGSTGWIENLVEGRRVDGDARVVTGEGLLARNVEHLLHDIHLFTHLIDIGHDQAQARGERARIAPEPLHRVGIALRNRPDAHGDRHHHDEHQHDDEDIETTQQHEPPRQPRCRGLTLAQTGLES
jgi:hypothetical protein